MPRIHRSRDHARAASQPRSDDAYPWYLTIGALVGAAATALAQCLVAYPPPLFLGWVTTLAAFAVVANAAATAAATARAAPAPTGAAARTRLRGHSHGGWRRGHEG
jgi:hypothetical protein